MLQSDNNPLRAGPTTQPKTPAIPCSAKNLASAARRHPRVLPATEDTKGEIMGIHRCDKRLRFRHDFFRRGRLAGDRRKSPADRLVRLDVPQLGLSGGSKISRVGGGLCRIKARGGSSRKLTEFGFQLESRGFFPLPNVASWSANSGARPEGIPRTREMR